MNQSPPDCPQDGLKMVLRTARKGRYAGSQFWGCSRFPECKEILPFDDPRTYTDIIKEKLALLEREQQIEAEERQRRERDIAERERQLQARERELRQQPNRNVRQYQKNRYDCRDVGVCNRSYDFNSVVPDRQYKRSGDRRPPADFTVEKLMKGQW